MVDAIAGAHPAILDSLAAGGAASLSPDASDAQLREAAKQFEIMFAAEMLKAAKVGETHGPFSGGYGEEAFRSFLVREYATSIAEQGTLGLATQIYQELKEKVAAHG